MENFDFKQALLNYGFNEELVNDWLEVRKAKKATNTQTSFKKFITEVKKLNVDINVLLEECISRDWKGFRAVWYVNILNQENKIQQPNLIGRMNAETVANNLQFTQIQL